MNTWTHEHMKPSWRVRKATPTGMNKKLEKVLTSYSSFYYWERLSLDSAHETECKRERTNRCSQSRSFFLREHEDEISILSSCLFLLTQSSSHFLGWGNLCGHYQKTCFSNHNLYRWNEHKQNFTQRYDSWNANSMWPLKNKLLTHESLVS